MILRRARAGDAAAIAAIYAPHVVAGTISFETEPPDAAAIAARLASSGGLYPWLAAEDAGAVLGYAYAGQFNPREAYRWAVETSIYVAEAGQRRGVGRRLYGALLATLAAQGFTQAIGRIALPNAPSVALHEALGFVATGLFKDIGWKAGRWVDVGLWQLALSDAASGPPEEPRPFAAIAEPPSTAS